MSGGNFRERALLLLLTLILGTATSAYSATELERIRFWTAPDHTRIVIDVSGQSSFTHRVLGDPHRIAIDVDRARFKTGTSKIIVNDGVVDAIRMNELRSGKAQVVLDVWKRPRYQIFALDPVQGKPHRIVIDVYRDDGQRAPPPQPKPAAVEESTQPATTSVTEGGQSETAPAEPVAERPFVKKITRVVIDAGHGGEDPGAKGLYGLREKELTLDVARRLARRIDRHPDMEAVLTRDGDYFLSLGQRSALARKERGDIFISIHANAARSRSASGFELFFLSLRGSSDKMARELADKENAADLIGGIEPTEDEVLSIVFDYLQEEGMQKSAVLAESIYKRFQRDDSIRLRNVRQAGFAVLKTVEVPSVLVELGFISNHAEAKRLKSEDYRDKLSRLLFEAIEQYCQRVGGNGTRYHVVKDGETPWSIAERYSRTVKDLMLANNLAPDAVLRVGQKLRVP